MLAQNPEQLLTTGVSFTVVLFWNKQEQSLEQFGQQLVFSGGPGGLFVLLRMRWPTEKSLKAGVRHRQGLCPRAEAAPRTHPAIGGTRFSPASRTLLLSNSF